MTPQELLQLFQKRRSVRTFTGEPLTAEELDLIREAGRWAASSSNKQARRFILIHGREEVARFAQEARMNPFAARAGLLVLGWSTNVESRGATADVFISMTQMETMAWSLGLGTCWLGTFARDDVPGMVGGAAPGWPVMMMAIGRYEGEGHCKEKMAADEMFLNNHF